MCVQTTRLQYVEKTKQMPPFWMASPPIWVCPNSRGKLRENLRCVAPLGSINSRVGWHDTLTQSQNASTVIDEPLATPGPSSEESVTDTLTGLEQFYDVGDNLAQDVDGQLSNIINNQAKTGLSNDKLKEKLRAYVQPGNCDGLTITRVNPEIWEKLSAATKSRDLKAQHGQNSTIQAITGAADNIVGSTRKGKTLLTTKNLPIKHC